MVFSGVTDLYGEVTDLYGEVTELYGEVTDLYGEVTDLYGEVHHFSRDDLCLCYSLTDLQHCQLQHHNLK